MDLEFIRELFAQFRPVTVRRMFSGAGVFCDGLMFGLIVRDVIYLKVDDGKGELLNHTSAAGAAPSRPQNSKTKSSRLGRLFERLSERIGN